MGDPAGRSSFGRLYSRCRKASSFPIDHQLRDRALEEQLGIELFELRGGKACLTEAGRALLAEAEPYLTGFRQIEHRARSLAAGEGLEIRLSVDSLFPNHRLFAALAELMRRFPYVRPSLRQCTFLSADAEFSAHSSAFVCWCAQDNDRDLPSG